MTKAPRAAIVPFPRLRLVSRLAGLALFLALDWFSAVPRFPMSYHLCLFDFDGTIADTLEEARLILNELAAAYGFRPVPLEDLPALRLLSAKQLFRALGIRKRWVPVLLARGTRQLRTRVGDLRLIPGMDEVIRAAASQVGRCGILTSNTVENVELFLEAHGLREHFEFVSSVPKLSGKHKHLRSILRTFSLQPDELLYIGDELRDVKAAHRARVDMAAVSWGFNAREVLAEAKPRYLFDRSEELLALLHGNHA